ncbi:MAG: carbonic anhydrase [Planctomycetes bacterium]|nr:carbonic anhydrase [Planctomycetota bacterium]MCP4839129.1 carbonic anhydrase [Planctomycetota bacterium]
MAADESVVRPDSPDAAMAELVAGNGRYIDGRSESHNLPSARGGLAAGQSPFAAIIRCADSRVAPEIVFDQPLGELFVCGVAGNIPTAEIIASLEYGVAVLGCKAIVIMGHSACGAVDAAMEHRHDTNALPGNLPQLIDQIVIPCTVNADPKAPGALDAAIACNAKEGVERLMRGSQIIADAVKAGSLKIFAGVQDLKTGRFSLVK